MDLAVEVGRVCEEMNTLPTDVQEILAEDIVASMKARVQRFKEICVRRGLRCD